MRVWIVWLVGLILLIDATRPSRAQQDASEAASPAPRARSCWESFPRTASTDEFNKKCIALAGPLAAMRGDTLVIRMDDGSRRAFDNKTGAGASGDAFGFGLADFHPATHMFVVCDHGVDDGTCKAVDGKTGRELDFGYDLPRFSPSGDWALTEKHHDEGKVSDVVILDARGKQPVAVWSAKASKARLPANSKFVAWSDEKTIKLTGASAKPVFIVQAADGRWSLSATAR